MLRSYLPQRILPAVWSRSKPARNALGPAIEGQSPDLFSVQGVDYRSADAADATGLDAASTSSSAWRVLI
jgi:hypothetical protein